MTQNVYRYKVPVDDSFHPLPRGKVVLVHQDRTPGSNGGSIEVWIEVKSDEAEQHLYRTYGTGHNVPSEHTHVGSAVCGPFVWHLYWQVPSEDRLEAAWSVAS